MRFTTLSFLLFFITVYLINWSLRERGRIYLIVLSSIVFYAAWSVGFAFHFVGTVLINYYLIKLLHKKPSKGILTLLLVFDIGNLFLFKYFYLFIQAIFDLTGVTGFDPKVFNASLFGVTGAHSIVLPLAISFYTFQLVAYAVDVYRGQIQEEAPLMRFLAFILFFPQLVAGPIMRHSDFFHQLDNIRPDEKKMQAGMYLLMLGLIKKVVIADNLMAALNPIYQDPLTYDWLSNFNATSAFVLAIFCDFSGYTDIARGLGKLLGLNLPENFYGPLLSRSFREFWQTWHITLSTWMRDYLYIPLGGSRTGEFRNVSTSVFTMVLAGLWHGASYNFFLWGLMHGGILTAERYIRRGYKALVPPNPDAPPRSFKMEVLVSVPKTAFTYLFFCFVGIPFNSPNISTTWKMFGQILTADPGKMKSPDNDFMAGMVIIVLLLNAIQRWKYIPRWSRPVRYVLLGLMGFLTVYLLGRFAPEGLEFIYFQF